MLTTQSNKARTLQALAETLNSFWDNMVKFLLPPRSRRNDEAKTSSTENSTDSSNKENETPQNGAPNENHAPPKDTEDPFQGHFSLKKMLAWLHDAANISRSPFYKMGYKCGLDACHHNQGVAAIESGFDALIHSENKLREVFGAEIIEAQSQLEHLNQEVERLAADLDEQTPNSTAARLRQEIQTFKDEIKNHLSSQYNDRFVHDHQQIMEERKQTELAFIAQAKERILQKSEELKNIATQKERARAIEELESEQANLSKRYSRLATAHKNENIAVSGSTRIIFNLIFFLLTLGGEFFIIYHLTRKVLEMDQVVLSSNPTTKLILLNAIYVFCVAYPLALGILVKTIISKSSDRSAATRSILWVVGIASLLMIVGISVLNPTKLGDAEAQATLKDLIEPFLLYLYALIFFGITLLFSSVAGMLYVEFIDGYEQFCNARKKSPFKFLPLKDSDEFVDLREAEIIKREDKIEQLRGQKEKAHRRIGELQSTASINMEDWDLAATLESLKQAAANAFRLGHQRGLSDLMRKKEYDPAALLDMVYSRKVMRHYLKSFDENA